MAPNLYLGISIMAAAAIGLVVVSAAPALRRLKPSLGSNQISTIKAALVAAIVVGVPAWAITHWAQAPIDSVSARKAVAAISSLADEELAGRAINLVRGLRALIVSADNRLDNLLAAHASAFRQGALPKGRADLLHKTQVDVLFSSLANEYAAKYKADAVLYRDELLRRVIGHRVDPQVSLLYDTASTPETLSKVADELEMLAKTLQVGRLGR